MCQLASPRHHANAFVLPRLMEACRIQTVQVLHSTGDRETEASSRTTSTGVACVVVNIRLRA